MANRSSLRLDETDADTSIIQRNLQERRKSAINDLGSFSIITNETEGFSNKTAADTLVYIAGSAGLAPKIKGAIKAVATLLEMAADEDNTKVIRAKVGEEVEKALRRMEEKAEELTKEIQESVTKTITETGESISTMISRTVPQAPHIPSPTPLSTWQWPKSFSDAVRQAPPHANPRLQAKEAIRDRQVLLTGLKNDGRLNACDKSKLKQVINESLAKLNERMQVRSAMKFPRGDILLEAKNDEAALWLRNDANIKKLQTALNDTFVRAKKNFRVLVKFVPLHFDPPLDNLDEFLEANELEKEDVIGMRWVKPRSKHLPGQKVAHLFVSFSDPDAANHAIVTGLKVCNQWKKVERDGNWAIRCRNCYGFDHIAKNCKNNKKCGRCGEQGHIQKDCKAEDPPSCITCKTSSHKTFDTECPVYINKCIQAEDRDPSKALIFFPTEAAWTWRTRDRPITEEETRRARTKNSYKPDEEDEVQDQNIPTPASPRHTRPMQGPANRLGSHEIAPPAPDPPVIEAPHRPMFGTLNQFAALATPDVDSNDNFPLPPLSPQHSEDGPQEAPTGNASRRESLYQPYHADVSYGTDISPA